MRSTRQRDPATRCGAANINRAVGSQAHDSPGCQAFRDLRLSARSVHIFLILIPFIGHELNNLQKDFVRVRSAGSAYDFDLFMIATNVDQKSESRPLEENGYNDQCLEATMAEDCSDDC